MMDMTELDNEVLKSQLSKKFNHKVKIGFGLDVGKIKGVSDFPVYDKTNGYTSNAKKNVDSYMFHSTNKYDVKKGSHTEVGSMNPYLYDDVKLPAPKDTNFRTKAGIMSSFYGIPPDRTIVLENPTAQAMNMMGGKMTERKMRDHIWRDQADFDSFMKDPAVMKFMDVDALIEDKLTRPNPTPNNDEIPTEEIIEVPPPPIKIPKPRAKTVIKPVVSHAFPTAGEESKKEAILEETKEESNKQSKEESNTQSKEESKTPSIEFLREELFQTLKDTSRNGKISNEHKEKLNKLLTDKGLSPVSRRVTNTRTYINKFNEILKTNPNIDWKKELDKSIEKKAKETVKSPSPKKRGRRYPSNPGKLIDEIEAGKSPKT